VDFRHGGWFHGGLFLNVRRVLFQSKRNHGSSKIVDMESEVNKIGFLAPAAVAISLEPLRGYDKIH
jgi:hypothetical protein